MKIWEKPTTGTKRILEHIEWYSEQYAEQGYVFDGFKVYPTVGVALCFVKKEEVKKWKKKE